MEDKKDEAAIALRIPAALRNAVQELADKSHRTLSGEVRMALEQHVASDKK